MNGLVRLAHVPSLISPNDAVGCTISITRYHEFECIASNRHSLAPSMAIEHETRVENNFSELINFADRKSQRSCFGVCSYKIHRFCYDWVEPFLWFHGQRAGTLLFEMQFSNLQPPAMRWKRGKKNKQRNQTILKHRTPIIASNDCHTTQPYRQTQ